MKRAVSRRRCRPHLRCNRSSACFDRASEPTARAAASLPCRKARAPSAPAWAASAALCDEHDGDRQNRHGRSPSRAERVAFDDGLPRRLPLPVDELRRPPLPPLVAGGRILRPGGLRVVGRRWRPGWRRRNRCPFEVRQQLGRVGEGLRLDRRRRRRALQPGVGDDASPSTSPSTTSISLTTTCRPK